MPVPLWQEDITTFKLKLLQDIRTYTNAEDHWQEPGPEGWTQTTTGDLETAGEGSNKDVNVTRLPFYCRCLSLVDPNARQIQRSHLGVNICHTCHSCEAQSRKRGEHEVPLASFLLTPCPLFHHHHHHHHYFYPKNTAREFLLKYNTDLVG